jgi:hypothetical protein
VRARKHRKPAISQNRGNRGPKLERDLIPVERALRAAGSVTCGSTDCDAEGLEKVLAGVSIDASAFVEKMSGSRPGCP